MEVTENFTLLLVDDNPTNLMLLAQIIEMDLPNVRVLQARSAREGLALVDEEAVDGAFIDVQMPHVSGLDMCRELRKRPHTANIPLVLLTAHMAAPEMRAEGLEVGAYDFITQPISNVEMLARVKVMLRMCSDDRRISQNRLQLKQELYERSDHLRWISGLLISGNGALKEQDEAALQRLSEKVAEMKAADAQLSFDQVVLALPMPWRRTLLKLALLESVPMPLAHELSEINDIRAVVTYLERHDVLVLDQGSCSERLIFNNEIRTFLCQRAYSDLSESERQKVLVQAANWYRCEKDYRGVVSCLVAAQRYEEVALIFSQIGFSIGMHRFSKDLLDFVGAIPDDVLVTNGWLTLFKARSLLTAFSPDTTTWLELAWQQFEANQDPRGLLLTMALQAVQSIYIDGSYENWTDRVAYFRHLYAENADALHPTERFKVLFAMCLLEIFVNGDLGRADAIVSDSLASAQQQKHAEAQLEFTIIRINIALWQGRQRVAAAFLEQGFKLAGHLNDPVFDLLLEKLGCGFLHARGDHRGVERLCRGIVSHLGSTVLQRTVIDSQLTFLQVLLLLPFAEQMGAFDLLDISLTNTQRFEYGHPHSRLLQVRGLLKALSGQESEARSDMQAALQLRQQAGGMLFSQENRLLTAMTCYQLKDYEQAQSYLDDILAEESLADRIRPGVHAWLAAVLLKRRKRTKALEQFRLLMDCLRKQRNCYFWGLTRDLPDSLLPLISSKQDIGLLRPMFEKFQSKTLTMDGQPIPLLKVRCLGVFEVELAGRVFSMGDVGHASRQIFSQLLAAPGLSLSIEKIMTSLWPDSAPPKARNSFDTAHLRLRKALEAMFGDGVRKDYLVLEKGLLSLRHAQIDSAAFCQTYERVLYHLQRENFWQAENACRNMDQLWQGKFLNGYDLDDELAALGEQLIQMRIDQLSHLANLLIKKHKGEEAKGLLLQCLNLDPTQDSIIRQLLLLYRGQRDYRSASALLEQYRKALLAEEYDQDEVDELLEALDGKWSSVAEL